jgi:hypothetical protein
MAAVVVISGNHPLILVVGADPVPRDGVSFNHAERPVIVVYPVRIMVSCSSNPSEFQAAMTRVVLE